MSSFWEEIRQKVRDHTTSADVSSMVYQKLATTGVQGPAIVKPAFYLGHLSMLTMDFIKHVERLQEIEDRDWAGHLRSICFLRENARSVLRIIGEISDPLERIVAMVEEILEGEEFAALEDEEAAEREADDEEAPSDEDDDEDISLEHDVEREEMSGEREALEETLRVKFRTAGFSDGVVNELCPLIGAMYLECVQLAKELSRLSKAPDADNATIMSILIDLQYGLDSQLRGLLQEDVNTTDVEPTFRLGFLTWSAHFLGELMDTIDNEKPATVASALEK